MYNAAICRYHEIATKGNNRSFFENTLMENIRLFLRSGGKDDAARFAVRKVQGRIWIEKTDHGDFSEAECQMISGALKKTYGLSSFSFIIKTAPDMEHIRQAALKLGKSLFDAAPSARTFRVRARRSNKDFALRSQEIEIRLVSDLADALGEDRFTLDLDHAELTLGCEVRHEFAALFSGDAPCPGGLPVGCNPKVLCLLSGGIDSPVAASMIQKRGCAVDFITFHSSPYTPPETVDKVRKLAALLNTYQRGGKLYLCNLLPLQKEIRDKCTERLRTVLYRRAMLRIAEKVAAVSGCKALATGEAVGQVASQTIPNMIAISAATSMLILRPVVGMDKNETIARAERLGTFDISKLQVPDSCTVFAPSSPSTSVPEAIAAKEEKRIENYDALLAEIVQNTLDAAETPRL